jgi:hypothetical protein
MLFTRIIGRVCGLKRVKVKKRVIEDLDVTLGFQIKTERQMEFCQQI